MAQSVLHFYFVRTYTNFFKQDETEFSVLPNAMGKFNEETIFRKNIFKKKWIPHKAVVYCRILYKRLQMNPGRM